MEEAEDMTINELEKLEEVDTSVEEDAFEVNEGICKECNEKLIKVVENRSILDGTITFHIIKLKCPKCGNEYLDLDQAEKYDFALILEKAVKQPLDKVSRRILNN